MPILLRPTAPVAADVLLPGDPGRALALAQALLGEPRMSNHAHGLWGYSGETAEGRPLTIQSTGVGGPSAALVLGDLAELGARRAIRVGPCVGLEDAVAPAQTLVCERAIAGDGTSRAIGAGDVATPHRELTERLAAEGPGAGVTVASADLIHRTDGTRLVARELERRWAAAGAVAVEMQAATLFALGCRLGIEAGCLLVVSDLADGRSAEPERLDDAVGGAAARAVRALAA